MLDPEEEDVTEAFEVREEDLTGVGLLITVVEEEPPLMLLVIEASLGSNGAVTDVALDVKMADDDEWKPLTLLFVVGLLATALEE